MEIKSIMDCILDIDPPDTLYAPIKFHIAKKYFSLLVKGVFHPEELKKIRDYVETAVDLSPSKKLGIIDLHVKTLANFLFSRFDLPINFTCNGDNFKYVNKADIKGIVINPNQSMARVSMEKITNDQTGIYIYIPLVVDTVVLLDPDGVNNLKIDETRAYIYFEPISVQLIKTGFLRSALICKYYYEKKESGA
jgi:hypothetical protein